MTYAIYIACVVGAVALLLMMPRQGYNPRKIGALLGAATLGGLWLVLARELPESLGLARGDGDRWALAYYYIFSALAMGSAVRVITHTRPVYSALWFVMVVLASAGLFLILNAEFIAYAMIIIYGGAILVTYVFVIMLASQSGDPQREEGVPGYDRVAREPVAAIVAGFLLLAVLLTVLMPEPPTGLERSAFQDRPDQQVIAESLTERPEARLNRRLGGAALPEHVASRTQLENVERVGLDLFQRHPLGLELAGVILLVSLVGAVVIARTQVPQELEPPRNA